MNFYIKGQQKDNKLILKTIETPINRESPIDPVRNYDYAKSFDVLEQPSRRVPRHEIPRFPLKDYIDIPPRGYPDTFSQLGILILDNDNNSNNHDNQILRLFGRQEYPSSDRYEYYTLIHSGNDSIKIPLSNKSKTRMKELYDGDKIFIKELDSHYKVQLHDYDYPRYYPDIV